MTTNKIVKIPFLLERISKLFLSAKDQETIVADLGNYYTILAEEKSIWQANLWYFFQMLNILKGKLFNMLYWSMPMFKNNIKIAFRNIVKYKGHSFINIIGLSIGIAFCVLAFMFVQQETSYDTFHENGDRIFLSLVQQSSSGDRKPSGSTPPVLAPTLLENIPEVESAVRLFGWFIKDGVPVHANDKSFLMSGYYVDPDFFQMFSFPQISGNTTRPLQDQKSVVISQGMAKKYFGEENALGKTLTIRLHEGISDFFVSSVVQVPRNSSLQFDFLISYILKDQRNKSRANWGSNNVYTFLKLTDDVSAFELEQKSRVFFEQYFSKLNQERRSQGYNLRLLPLKKMYLNTVIRQWLTIQSNPLYSFILSGIALSVLLIACVNFVNLSIGQFSTRKKEIGIRKVVGASKGKLIKQYLSESILLSFFAALLSLLLASLMLPLFNQLMDRYLSLNIQSLWLPLLGIVLITGVLAGIYPALILSGFHPVDIFRTTFKLSGRNILSRVLVVLQFALSIILIIATLTMSRQMQYLRNINLGFKGEQVVVIDTGGAGGGFKEKEIRQVVDIYRQESLHNRNLMSVSMSSMSFGKGDYWGTGFQYKNQNVSCRVYSVDFDYFKTLGVALLNGREFTKDFPGDVNNSIIVNQAMVKVFDLQDPLGRHINKDNDQVKGTIIGVVEDTYLRSLRDKLEPSVYHLQAVNGSYRYILVRILPDEIPSTLQDLRKIWKKAVPYRPFIFSFLDEDVEQAFREDARWGDVTRFSSFIAIFISCLGALGLTSLAVVRRTREIGVRKVLGATVPNIIMLISKNLTIWILISNVIAWPVAYLIMDKWLQNFAYRINVEFWIFVFAGILALVIAFLSVGYQSLKAALANPVDALKYE